ncbi:hypothetical protein RGUI_1905 [Rhodovulum sp. P5]|nr:hypothetical protein RGUI_1905 [Rhodovulum sp. P5]
MQMKLVDESFSADKPAKAADKPFHAVTPNVNLKAWDGVPPYAVWAFFGYLLALAVLFSGQVVPYCEANFARPQNCAPLFEKIAPVALAGIVLAPAIGGAVRRMGGNRATGLAFALAVTVLPPLILGWKVIF